MRIRTIAVVLLCGLIGGLAIGASDASAFRERLAQGIQGGGEEWLLENAETKEPVDLEGACGAAVSPTTREVFVSDYYHRRIGFYSPDGLPPSRSLGLPGENTQPGINSLNAVCGLAIDAKGNLYGDELHQAVIRLLPNEQVIDAGDSTGIAADAAGDLFVNDRTYVAVYDAPVEPGEAPAEKIGGNLDAYGLAVDPTGKTVYVADVGDNTVKGFEPGVSLTAPQVTIAHDFTSLVDAAIAVDPTNGHVLVVENSKPGFENPLAVVDEFDASGTFLDRLSNRVVGALGQQHAGPIFGEPSGIAVDPLTGDLYVTTGNSEGANVVKYGPFEPFAPLAAAEGSAAASAFATRASGAIAAPSSSAAGASASAIVQRRGVRVSFDGKLTPHALPRHGVAPVGIVVDTKIGATGGEDPPQLRRISIAINRNGQFTSKGLPSCRIDQIQPSTTAGALAACRRSLVGEGSFTANVKFPEQSPFPSAGKVLAFNGRVHGKPAILAHIYGTQPVPTSIVLSFVLAGARGTYGTILEASLPQATGSWGYVTGLRMNLQRRFSSHGRAHSYLSAGCPAPAGFPSAAFPLARTSFDFAGNLKLTSVLNQTCRAQG